jgi:hypothetical protein
VRTGRFSENGEAYDAVDNQMQDESTGGAHDCDADNSVIDTGTPLEGPSITVEQPSSPLIAREFAPDSKPSDDHILMLPDHDSRVLGGPPRLSIETIAQPTVVTPSNLELKETEDVTEVNPQKSDAELPPALHS